MSKTLIIRGGAIGDFILTLPIFEAVRSREPDVEVEVLGYSHIADLAVGRRHAQGQRRVDGAEWAALFAREGELGETERSYLRAFDEIYCVWPDGDGVMRKNLLSAGAQRVLSVNPMPPEGGRAHAVEFMADQCGKAGLPVPYVEPHLYPSERDRWWTERYMRVTGAGERPLLAIAPGSGSARKNWPAAGFVRVARDWIQRSGHVLVAGGPADEAPLAEVRQALGEDRVFYFVNEPLPKLAAVLERCEAFVGNDSGVTHMAAAVRTRTIALFGPTKADLWRPRAPRVSVLQPSGDLNDWSGLPPERVIRELTALVQAP